jgi:hypothetical protein
MVVEGDALYDAGNFLGRWSAFKDCGIHARRLIFSMGGLGVTRKEAVLRRLGLPDGFRLRGFAITVNLLCLLG